MGQFFNQPDFGTEAAAALANDSIKASTTLKGACLYVGTAGDVKVVMVNKYGPNGELPVTLDAITFKNVPAGSILPVIVDFLLATGTTASDFIALK
jgi:hypothetical protein|tara:strand:- start:133 stop:420 length:288 start_codon:yes stop_codon:yes gene_type:complete